VIETYGSERQYRKALEGNRGAAPMTPDELVKSAESFLLSCSGPHGEQLVKRLNIHFRRKSSKTHSAISVRGHTLSVPLPNQLTPSRAMAVSFGLGFRVRV
jgi:hypothetical protein